MTSTLGYVVVLSGDQEGKIDAWRYSEDNKATLLPWKSLKAHGSAVLSMNFDTGGSRFVSVSEDKIIRLWQTSSCDCLYSVMGHNRYISRAVFTPNSKELVTGSNDRTFKVWQIEDLVQANTSRKVTVLCMLISHLCDFLITGQVDDWSKGDVQSWLVKNIEGKTEQGRFESKCSRTSRNQSPRGPGQVQADHDFSHFPGRENSAAEARQCYAAPG